MASKRTTTVESNGEATAARTKPKVVGPWPLPDEYIIGPTGTVTAWLFVTPEMAFDALVYNTANRKLRQHISDLYTRDMASGIWKVHHQGIAFGVPYIQDDKETTDIADGQHRLSSIFESGVGQWLMVTWGIDNDAKKAIDSQFTRTALDVLHLAGKVDVAAADIAIVKRMYNGLKNSAGNNMTKGEVEQWLVHYAAGLAFVHEAFPEVRRGLGQAGVQAVVARAYYTADTAKLRRFCEILISGNWDSSADHPAAGNALKLRDMLVGETKSNKKTPPGIVYAKTERALAGFLADQKLGAIYAATKELFPLPDLPSAPKTEAANAG